MSDLLPVGTSHTSAEGTGSSGAEVIPRRRARPIAFLRSFRSDPERRNLALTVGAGLTIQLALVITGPFLARLLGPAGRGELAALMLWPAVLVQVGGLGIPAAITYYLSSARGSFETIRTSLRFFAWQAVALTALQVVIVLLVFADRGAEVREAAVLTIAAVPGLLAQQYGLAILQARSDLRAFNLLRVLPVAVFAVAVIVLFVLSAELTPVVVAWVAASTVVGTATLVYALRRSRVAPGPEPIATAPARREMLSFGLRSVLGANSANDIIRFEQIALVLFLPARALGLYVVGLAFTHLPYFLAKAIGQVAFPAVAREPEAQTARRVAWRYVWLITGLASVIVLALAATVSTLIPLFFGEEFSEAVDLTYILLGGAFFNAVRRVLAECLRGRGQPGAGTAAELTAIAWLLIALAVLIPAAELTGVAVALASSQVASFLVILSIGIRRDELRRDEARSALKSALGLTRADSSGTTVQE